MKTINNIPVLTPDNIPTPAGVDLMRRVHEAMGMGCWHDWEKVVENLEDIFNIYVEWNCKHCNAVMTNSDQSMLFDTGPNYLQSLDAWRPVWDKMREMDIAYKHAWELNRIIDHALRYGTAIVHHVHEAHPHHHLEAIARVLEVECKCAVAANIKCVYNPPCTLCSGGGKRTILDVWSEEWDD